MTAESTRLVAFIRNVMTGRAGLTQEVARRTFGEASALAPRSHYATGNVSFTLAQRHLEEVIESAETKIAEVIGRREPMFVRSVATLQSVMDASPSFDTPIDDVQDRCVTFTSTTSAPSLPLDAPRGDAFIYGRRGTDFYSVTRLVGGRAGSPNLMIERALSCRASTRNWSTVERIVGALATKDSTPQH